MVDYVETNFHRMSAFGLPALPLALLRCKVITNFRYCKIFYGNFEFENYFNGLAVENISTIMNNNGTDCGDHIILSGGIVVDADAGTILRDSRIRNGSG